MIKRILSVNSLAFLLISCATLGSLSALAESTQGAGSASCDAACRQAHQGDSAALQACQRNCGIGPAESAGQRSGPCADHSGKKSTTVKSSKSNSSERQATPSPAQGTTVKSSKSNSSERSAVPAPESEQGSQPNESAAGSQAGEATDCDD